MHTDNCAPQYKCRQNFLQVATACNKRDGTVVHKFAQKYRFKGSWDATGKLIKQAINRLEMRNERLPDAKTCYFKLREELGKDGTELKTRRLLEYERLNNRKMIKNTTLTSRRTFIGLGVENEDEYNELKQEEKNRHIVYTNRTRVPDMKRVPGTQDFFQVQGHKEQLENGNYKLDTFHLQCSCSNCRRNPQDVEACHYLQDRKWKRVEVSEMEKENDIEYNKEYYQNLTVTALKEMLREKNLPVSGRKDEIIQRIMLPPDFSDEEAAECEEEESDDDEESEDDECTNQG